MRLLPVQNNDSGFTLIELLVIVAIIGILAAMSAPSFMAMNQRAQINEAMTQVRGALQEAQREAMRRSRNCNVTLNTTTRQITSTDNCLVTGPRTLSNNITLRASTTTFGYDFKGRSTAATTIVVAHSASPNLQRCVILSTPLGLVRGGNYSGAGTTEASCTPLQT